MKLNKNNINIIKSLCSLIPKTSPKNMSTSIFFGHINNKLVIYGGNTSLIKFIYYTNIDNNSIFALIAYTFNIALKTIKNDIECKFHNNHFTWIENKNITNLKTISVSENIECIDFTNLNYTTINTEEFINAIKSINIKIDLTTKCYIHFTNNNIRFIIIDTGRLSLSFNISCLNTIVLFATCNYESLLHLTTLLIENTFNLYLHNNIMICKQNNIEFQVGLTKANFINYNKYLNIDSNVLIVKTNQLYDALKSLACINKSQTEIVSIKCENNELVLECYNPNIGSKIINIDIVKGELTRNLKFSLTWLTEALKTVNTNECNLIYGNTITHPLIIQNDNVHVIAPVVSY